MNTNTTFTGSDWYGAVVVLVGEIHPHPDPETTNLEITRVLGVDGDEHTGIPVVVKKGQFKKGDRAVYTGIDSIVPTNTERFSFLASPGKDSAKIKARRLRGFFSEGLLTPAIALGPTEEKVQFVEGSDITVALSITKFLTESEMEPVELVLPYELPPGSALTLGAPPEPTNAQFTIYVDDIRKAFNRNCPAHAPVFEIIDKQIQYVFDHITSNKLNGWNWITKELVDNSIPLWTWKDGNLTVKIQPKHKKGHRPGGQLAGADSINFPYKNVVSTYNLDAIRKWGSTLFVGKFVSVREKLHGAQFRAMYDGENLWVGTHHRWLKPEGTKSTWWIVAKLYNLEEKLKQHPFYVIHGEMFGMVQDLKYGATPDRPYMLALFDVLKLDANDPHNRGQYLSEFDLEAFCKLIDIPMTPLLYRGIWDEEKVYEMRNGQSVWPGANNIREGVVIRLIEETVHPRLGRIVLKLVGENYKLR